MTLATGFRLGSYEVIAPIGAGGMGEVYRARDTRLGRQVALKVLPAFLADDASRVARFEQEAKTLATLNHPNIAQIHGLEHGDGITALVLELVEGPTLVERVAAGPLAVDEALAVATQIADALEAAHEHGIVHRDLKPANIKVRADGTVKVLDFGIAKTLSIASEPAPSALATQPVTEVGTLLGTAAYMSPEQACGKPVDRRTDVWAFGCLLFEVLTGRAAFGGEDATTTLAAVLRGGADLAALPQTVPPAVRRTIELCLEKDPRRRIADIRDVRLALEGKFGAGDGAGRGAAAGGHGRRVLWIGMAFALGGTLAAAAMLALRPPVPPPAELLETRLSVIPPPEVGDGNPGNGFAVSPDGKRVVVTARGGASPTDPLQLWLWELDTISARPLPGTDNAQLPFWSPDGRFIAFGADGHLKFIEARGGPAQTIAANVGYVGGGVWTRDDTIVFNSSTRGLARVSARGGEPTAVTVVADAGAQPHHELPTLLPDGRHLLYFNHSYDQATEGIYVAELDASPDAQPKERLIAAEDGPVFIADRRPGMGYVLFARGGVLLAQRFDTAALALMGQAVAVAEGVTARWGTASFSASVDGALLLYAHGEVGLNPLGGTRELVWVARDGTEQPLAAPPRNYNYADVSPDGRLIALDIGPPENDIWMFDVERNTLTRLTSDAVRNQGLAWSPDSRRIAFSALREEIHWQAADGSGSATPFGVTGMPTHITADGGLLYGRGGFLRNEVYWLPAGGSGAAAPPLLSGSASIRNASVSPNGRYVAYQSSESGRNEVYVRPFPNVAAGRWQLSVDGGTRPIWSADGTELFYYVPRDVELYSAASNGALMSVAIEYSPEFRAARPQRLFEGAYQAPHADLHTYDVSPDGQRFLMFKKSSGAAAEPAALSWVVVQHWLERVKRETGSAE